MQGIISWFKRQNGASKFLWLRSFWRFAKGLVSYHSLERLVNWLEVQLNCLTGRWQPLTLAPSIINRVFYACRVEGDPAFVIKRPRGDGELRHALIQCLRSAAAYREYRELLLSLNSDPWLGPHTVSVWDVRRDGGYSCNFVNGLPLTQIREEVARCALSPTQRDSLIIAIDELVHDLRRYSAVKGPLIGDWMPHNLIFSEEARSIVNVDAEGFFQYGPGSSEASLSLLEDNLATLRQLLSYSPDNPADRQVLSVFRAIDEVRKGDEQYSASVFMAGYHTLVLRGQRFRGQRECAERLAQVPYDFAGKRVLDLGCNVGGMLHALAGAIQHGTGVDRSADCVNSARLIQRLSGNSNLDFFCLDLDRKDLRLLESFLPDSQVDICLMLSLCRWLTNWRDVMEIAATHSHAMLLETNGSAAEQHEQRQWSERLYHRVDLVSATSSDDRSLASRALYLCVR